MLDKNYTDLLFIPLHLRRKKLDWSQTRLPARTSAGSGDKYFFVILK
jgi:hypothetical protein